MVVTEHVQHTMHHQSHQLLSNRASMLGRIPPRHARGDVDVSDHRPPGLDRREPERDHVRRPGMREMRAVERRDATIAHERDRQQRVTYALPTQYAFGEGHDARARDRNANPFECHVHRQAHTVAGSLGVGVFGYSTRAWYMPPSTRANSRFTIDS